MKPVIVLISSTAMSLAQKVQSHIDADIHVFKTDHEGADVSFQDARAHLGKLFKMGTPIVAVMAAGAVIRLLAEHIQDKYSEPPVLVLAEDGSSVVPLLGGHHGANDLARDVSMALNVAPSITTAGDLKFGVALDMPPEGYVLKNPDQAKGVMAALVNGASVDLIGSSNWLSNSDLVFENGGDVQITVTEKVHEAKDLELVYYKKSLVLGVGCERGCSAEELEKLVRSVLKDHGLATDAVGLVASIDLKSDEQAVHALANSFSCNARFFNSDILLAQTDLLQTPSDIVFSEVGCYGVAEGAALAAAGADGDLIVAKQKSKRATVAIAIAQEPFVRSSDIGHARGNLYVVGIGPGQEDWRSPEVTKMISASSDLVGYSLYLDLVEPLIIDQKRHDFDLGKEEERVRYAMELAGQGKSVSLVCSGDAGIYAMATLVFELLDKSGGEGGLTPQARRIEIAVSPGISALQAAAARAGAPLGHDFCTISLSDLLTPWDDIKRRVSAAADGDFVVAFYNPVSKKRRTQLAWAKERLLEDRPASTPVILATNLGRNGEAVRVVALGDLDIDDVDMLTVVIVGSSDSRLVATGDGKQWVYTPRGYSGKAGSAMS